MSIKSKQSGTMEIQTLAEMIEVRKTKAKPRPRKIKEVDIDEYPKPPRKPTTVEENAKLTPILAGKLGEACQQRDNAQSHLEHTRKTLFKTNDKQVETFGRLYKYEGMSIIQETLEYAEQNGLFIQCDSKLIGIYTKLSPVIKGKKTYLAHLTHYNRFIKTAKEDDVPESYKGNFLYKSFKPQFDALLKKNLKSFTCLEDLFNLSEGSPI